MPSFAKLNHAGIALIDSASGARIQYSELAELADSVEGLHGHAKDLVFLLARNDVASIVGYLAALRAGHCVALLDAGSDPDDVNELMRIYRPRWVMGSPQTPAHPDGLSPEQSFVPKTVERSIAPETDSIHDEVAVLLTTSGSTGSPKMVRLSHQNLDSNAVAIAESLELSASERPITTMPLHYSYGMSVVNSHLAVGATIILTSASVLERRLWSAVDQHGATSFAAVPYTFQMLKRVRYDPSAHPSVRTVTQAGGRLAPDLVVEFSESLRSSGAGLAVMYGQTEAAPRISCLPPSMLPAKVGSVGLAMKGGNLTVTPAGDHEGAAAGEVTYNGPNVMMGYATSRADLGNSDDCGGVLHTGDLGRFDDEGFLYLTGRLKRIAKIFGVRTSLDDMESLAGELGAVAAVAGEDSVHLFHCVSTPENVALVRKKLSAHLRVPLSSVQMHRESELPILASGKFDYSTLKTAVRGTS